MAALVACSQRTQPAQSTQPTQPAVKTVAEFDTTGKTPKEIAQVVFDRHRCHECHTLGQKGKFGFTARGEEMRHQAEGCIPLLTAMHAIAKVPAAERNDKQKLLAAHFQAYGCTYCHQEQAGKLGLTEVGSKLASLHLSCSGVQVALNQ